MTMKLFIAHKVSGEDYAKLKRDVIKVCTALREVGHKCYCSFLDGKMRKEANKKIKIENSPELQEIKVSNVALRNKILDIIEKSEEGINKQDIKNNFKNINIDSEIEELIKEGQIFEVKGNYILLK